MFSSNVQVEFRDLLKAHTEAKKKEYDSHAYSAGYLESLADSMFYYLPKRQQKFFMAMMQDAVEKAKVTA